MSDLADTIRNKLAGACLANLATADREGRPWVRYVMVRTDDDLTMRIATFLGSRKVAHVRTNPEVHVCCGVTSPAEAGAYLQIQARAEVMTDAAERHRVWDDRLKSYFSGPDDPGFAVLKLTPYRIELHSLNSMTPRVWESGG